jgi:hypothetical protein
MSTPRAKFTTAGRPPVRPEATFLDVSSSLIGFTIAGHKISVGRTNRGEETTIDFVCADREK